MYLSGEERHPGTRGAENSQTEDMGRRPHMNPKQPPASKIRVSRTQAGWIDGLR